MKDNILYWEKPPKIRSTEEHNRIYSSDSEIPGTYVPNMSKADRMSWRAELVGIRKPPLRVIIRKTFQGDDISGRVYGLSWRGHADKPIQHTTQVKMVVDEHGNYQWSANGTVVMSKQVAKEFSRAIEEAIIVMSQWITQNRK